MTEPPPRQTFSGNVTQWEIFDAYQDDFEKQVSLVWFYITESLVSYHPCLFLSASSSEARASSNHFFVFMKALNPHKNHEDL